MTQHPFEGRGGGMSQPIGPAKRKQTHRELMYDKQTSTRGFKRATRQTTAGAVAELAWHMGQASAECPGDCPRRWRTNPFRAGTRRHKLYEQGREAVLQDQAERRTERQWRA